eukprot:scaffold3469_cov211-Alexandrium_tamarense.AAC.2
MRGVSGSNRPKHALHATTVSGYEYVHSDITAMLLTRGHYWNHDDSSDDVCPFEVDQRTLQMSTKIFNDTDGAMPIHQLAYLANLSEAVLFSPSNYESMLNGSDTVNVSGKVMGLICLSRIPSSSWPSNGTISKALNGDGDEMPSPAILVATTVALNLLESSIRSIVRQSSNLKRSNGAPLLRDMIEEIATLEYTSQLAPILRALLLPENAGGINLRNLISHGFLSQIERRWFALVLVIIQTLDSALEPDDGDGTTPTQGDLDESDSSLKQYDQMAAEVQNGREMIVQALNNQYMLLENNRFVPDSHFHIMRFVFDTLQQTLRPSLSNIHSRNCSSDKTTTTTSPALTAVFVAALSSIIEHSLRLQWCKANARMNDCFARPSQYYVTLDGHGQRDRHDVMLSPYLRDGTVNQMIQVIGAPSTALLSDLFASHSAEAPNIRSAVCHGSFDAEIIRGLEELATWTFQCNTEVLRYEGPSTSNLSQHFLLDVSCALVSAFDMVSNSVSGQPRVSTYRPAYSFAAMLSRDLNTSLHNLETLEVLISNDSIRECVDIMKSQQSTLCLDLERLQIQLSVIKEMTGDFIPNTLENEWTVKNVFFDHRTNEVLVDCGAAQQLMREVSDVTTRYLSRVQLDVLSIKPKCTKDRRALKSMSRFCGAATIVHDFCLLALYIALLMLQVAFLEVDDDDNKPVELSRDEIVRVVERTTMTMSTFDAYISTNMDRSIRAIQQYVRGKALRSIIARAKTRSRTCR